jgi:hypothetical protein
MWRDSQAMTGFSAWCVVATETAVEARELPYAMLTAPFVLAIHPSRESAEKAMNRAILLREEGELRDAGIIERERSIRAVLEPGSDAWAASVAHEIAILNMLAGAVREITQSRKGKP